MISATPVSGQRTYGSLPVHIQGPAQVHEFIGGAVALQYALAVAKRAKGDGGCGSVCRLSVLSVEIEFEHISDLHRGDVLNIGVIHSDSIIIAQHRFKS